ncbi:MAG TPA: site-specific DNA-methyltransferase [Nitrososphaerales archaeon]|nr:site-specific DNA-methyltransferase [Nitrososphaerales archaeon]
MVRAERQKELGSDVWEPIVLRDQSPYYRTGWGAAYLGDAKELLAKIPTGKVDLIVTSPPFALIRKKDYGNVDAEHYVSWFVDSFAEQLKRVLAPHGSFVIEIGGSWLEGSPRKSLYNFELLLALSKKFQFIQDFYWYNPAKLPSPAEWVTVRRVRVKDAVSTIWWFANSENPKADNRAVLRPYSDSMLGLLKNGYKAKLRPSGHDISEKFAKRNSGSIPPNIIISSNTDSNSRYLKLCRENKVKPHPARFPPEIPRFFIKFLTVKGDVVLDPFGGSNTTGALAESLRRRWLSFEVEEDYLKGSRFRFDLEQSRLHD